MLYSIQELITIIKTARKKIKLSQKDLGAKIGVPQSHISKIEKGVVDLQISSLIEIARCLNLELMLIPRSLVQVIQALQNTKSLSKQTPAYQLPDEEEKEEDAT